MSWRSVFKFSAGPRPTPGAAAAGSSSFKHKHCRTTNAFHVFFEISSDFQPQLVTTSQPQSVSQSLFDHQQVKEEVRSFIESYFGHGARWRNGTKSAANARKEAIIDVRRFVQAATLKGLIALIHRSGDGHEPQPRSVSGWRTLGEFLHSDPAAGVCGPSLIHKICHFKKAKYCFFSSQHF